MITCFIHHTSLQQQHWFALCSNYDFNLLKLSEEESEAVKEALTVSSDTT